MVQASGDRVEKFLAVVCLPGRDCGPGEVGEVGELAGHGDVADNGEGEGAGRGRHRAEADLGREGGPVFAQRDQPCPGAHRPGPGCPGVGGPVAAVSSLKAGGDQGLDRAAGQLAVRVAEHLLQPQVGQRERAATVGQRHPVLQRVDQLPRRCRGDGRRGPLWPGSRHRDHYRWRPGGRGGRQGRVDGDQAIQAAEGEHPVDDLRGDHQPQLRAADQSPLVGAGQGIGARVITGDRRGQVRDQRPGAAVDDRQQFLADRPVGYQNPACSCGLGR